jgi:hypothetical protein
VCCAGSGLGPLRFRVLVDLDAVRAWDSCGGVDIQMRPAQCSITIKKAVSFVNYPCIRWWPSIAMAPKRWLFDAGTSKFVYAWAGRGDEQLLSGAGPAPAAADVRAGAVRLTVCLTSGTRLQVSTLTSDTVLALKRMLLPLLPQTEGVAESRLKLIAMIDGQSLTDSAATLASCSIEDGAELLLVLMSGARFSDDQLERLKTGLATLRRGAAGAYRGGLHGAAPVLHEILKDLCESEAGACSEELLLAHENMLASPFSPFYPSLLFYLPQNNAVQITTELLGAFGDRDDLRQEYVLVEWDSRKTAVHHAAERGDPGVVQVLLNALDPDRCHRRRLSAMWSYHSQFSRFTSQPDGSD